MRQSVIFCKLKSQLMNHSLIYAEFAILIVFLLSICIDDYIRITTFTLNVKDVHVIECLTFINISQIT